MERHSRDALADLLYPGLARDRARAGLRQCLSVLRASLGSRWIRAEGDVIWLEPAEGLWVDVKEVGKQETAAGCEVLEQVEALFRGDFLAGFFLKDAVGFESWQTSLADGFRAQHSAILERMAALHLARLEFERAIDCVRRWLVIDPADERAHCALIRLFALAGKRAEALRQYERCRDVLQAELGVVPDAETEKLRLLVVQGQLPPLEPVRAPAAGPKPALNNLRPPQNAFIGRVTELKALMEVIDRPEVRLVTITGTAGTGKTRLAVEAARRLIDRFPDGVVFVDLAPLRIPDHVMASIGAALGVQDRQGVSTPLFALVSDFLKARRLLLVLDNFEHLLEAADTVAALIDRCPHVSILATSREALRLQCENEYLLPPLPVPEEGGRLKQLLTNDAVRLFVDRARAARHEFALGDEDAGAVARICIRLEGLPLAIELAAGRAKFLPPATLLSLLESRGSKVLAGGPRDMPARHRTLRDAIEWSYDLLGPAEKALLGRLAVFRGGFTLEAAAAVCPLAAGEDILRDLESLVEKSLVRQSVQDGEPWYVMFVAVHEFADKRLEESGEAPRILLQHAKYYLRLVELAEPVHDQLAGVQWASRLELEYSNIRAAVEWSTESSPEIALRTTSALERFLDRQGHWQEGLRWLRRALSSTAEATGMERWRAKALAALCNMTLFSSVFRDGMAAGEQSVELWRKVGDKQGLGHALLALGLSRSFVASTAAEVLELIEESVRLRREAGDLIGSSAAMYFQAYFTFVKGDVGEARELVRQNSELARETGDLVRRAALPGLLGLFAAEEGDYPGARTLIEEGLRLSRESTDFAYFYYLACSRGEIALLQGDHGQARAAFEEAFGPSRLPEEPLKPFRKLCGGLVSLREGRLSESLSLFGEGIELLRAMDSRWAQRVRCACLAGVAGVRLEEGHAALAARILGGVESMVQATDYLLGWGPLPSLTPLLVRREWERLVTGTRSALGTGAQAAIESGHKLPLEALVTLALAEPVGG